MVVELFTQEVINQMRAVSHREVAEIADAEARYRAEAGSEKTDELYRCIDDAHKRLSARCMRFLKATYKRKVDNLRDIPSSYIYEFSLSERRAINKAEGLIDAMHTFLLEYAMSKFYSIVSQGELSNKHSLLAIEAGNLIDQLLFTKQPPRV